MRKQTHQVKCEQCGHIQNVKSKLAYITCSNCTRKTPNTPHSKIPLTPEAELRRKAMKHS